MNCLKCEGPTQVIDRRGVRRRRECKACGHRFTTEEVVLGTPPRGPKPKKSRVYVPKVRVRPEPPPPRPKEPAAPVEAKKPARLLIEELREQRMLKDLKQLLAGA